MIGRQQRMNALAVTLKAWHLHGEKGFKVDVAGHNFRPLKDAETLGWVRFVDFDRCGLTEAGVEEVSQYHSAGMYA